MQVGATDDHPNVTDFPLGTQINLSFDPLTQVGMGSINGRIEQNLDSDMFRFIAPATGTAQVTITTPGSGLAPRVGIRGAANTVIVVATNGVEGTVTVLLPTGVTNQQYYIVVTRARRAWASRTTPAPTRCRSRPCRSTTTPTRASSARSWTRGT